MHIERNEQQENHEQSQKKKQQQNKAKNCEENRRMCKGKDLPFQIRLFSEANVKIRRIIPNNNNINKKKKKKKNRRKKTRVEY